MRVNSTFLAALVAVALGTGCHRGSDAARTTVVAGQSIGVVAGIGSAAGTAVVVPPDALPPGATVKIFPWLLDAPSGFAHAGPAARIEFDRVLAPGQSALVTLPFDPCLVLAQGAVPGDLVVLVVEYDGPAAIVTPLVIDAGDETVEFAVTSSVAVMALVPEGARAPTPPLVGLSTHALAVDADNGVWSWGLNYAGQLGGGAGDARNFSADVPGLSDVISVEAGDGFSAVLKGDGTVYAWGANFAGQLGPRAASVPLDQPAKVLGLGCIEKIAVGGTAATVLALGRDGMLYSWGRNTDGQAGQGSTDLSVAPGVIPMIVDPRDFDVANHGLAALATGGVVAWGRNDRGQVGDGTFVARSEPVPVAGLDGEEIVSVAAGGAFSLALSAGGTVWAWGANESGQLGDGTFVDRPEPVAVMDGVVAIAAAGRTALALDGFGDVWTWGAGESGQRADGTFVPVQAFPVPVGGFLSAVVDMDGGVDAFLVALANGELYAWGRNDVGQLGDGTFFNRSTPVEVR